MPAKLLDCGKKPAVPSMTHQSEAAVYVIDLDAWGSGCSDKLGRVKSLVVAE